MYLLATAPAACGGQAPRPKLSVNELSGQYVWRLERRDGGRALVADPPRERLGRNSFFSSPEPAPPQPTFSASNPDAVYRPRCIRIEKNASPSADQLKVMALKQFFLMTDAEAMEEQTNYHWNPRPPEITEKDRERGCVRILVEDTSLSPSTIEEREDRTEFFEGLSAKDRQDITRETDQQFWGGTNNKAGELIEKADVAMAEYWKLLRDDLIQKRQAIEALPEPVKKVLFSPDASVPLRPSDYGYILLLAQKLQTLTPEELDEYRSRVTAHRDNLIAFEQSIDRFIQERKQRDEDAQAYAKLESKLLALEDLYRRYRDYEKLRKSGALSTGAGGKAIATVAGEIRAVLDADLNRAGVAGVAGFERLIADYEKAFEKETLSLSTVLLDLYEHELYVQEQRYNKKPGDAIGLHKQLGEARRLYDQHDAIALKPQPILPPGAAPLPPGAAVLAPGAALLVPLVVGGPSDQQKAIAERADQVVRAAAAAGGHSVVEEDKFSRRRFARCKEADASQFILDYIAERRNDIAETRSSLKEKPTLMYRFGPLMEASYVVLEIKQGKIQDLIVQHHASEVHDQEVISAIKEGVIAIGAAFLTKGRGVRPVVARIVTFAIGTHQALEAYRHYERMTAANGAKMLSDDERPSVAWVIVAVVGAGIDAAVLAEAMPSILPAIRAFNAAPDAALLKTALASLPEKLNPDLLKAIVRGAVVEQEAKAAYQAIFPPLPPGTYMLFTGGGMTTDEVGRLLGAVYLSVKHRSYNLAAFLKTPQGKALVPDFDLLAPEAKAAVKRAHEMAVDNAKAIAERAALQQWDEEDILKFLASRKSMKEPIDQIMKEMDRINEIRAVGKHLPRNALDFAGKNYSFDLARNPIAKARLEEQFKGAALARRVKAFKKLAIEYPGGVNFTKQGYPDFRTFTAKLPKPKKSVVRVKATSNRTADFVEADRQAGITATYRAVKGLVWHHVEDRETMILIPRDVHDAVKHTGGVASSKAVVKK